MNCEQRMDDMQRFVDNDLTYAEQDNLMAHIKQCPDCAASFEQLQRLSAELSLLPMVTPPFSIVDSIMPKLAELDAQQQEAVHVAHLPTAKPKKKSILPWKIGGGLVAAAVIFGLIINMQPNNKFDASGLLQMSGASKESASATADDRSPTAKALAPEAAEASEAPMATDEETSSKIRVEFSTSVSTNGVETGNSNDSKEVKPDGAKAAAEEKMSDSILHTPASKQELDKQLVVPLVPNGSSYLVGADKAKHTPAPTAAPAAVPTPMPSATPVAAAPPTPAPPAPALVPAPANPTLASEDGNFIGMVERQIVQVQTPDGNRIYTSAVQWNTTDTIVLLQWQDNQRLIYEVRMQDGQVKRFIVDPTLKTEQEQKAE